MGRPDTPCAGCGKLLASGPGSLPPGVRRCRPCRGHKTPVRVMADIACGWCGKTFRPRDNRRRFCSLSCAGKSTGAAKAQVARAAKSPACRTDGCSNEPRSRSPWCRSCEDAKWPRDMEKARAHWRRHTHLRKAQTRRYDISLAAEREMRAKAKRCPLCSVRLIDEPYQPASKELDHMVPLGVGGTHTIGNVRIICRSCNVRRPRDGSDYTGPVTLWAIA